MRTVLVVQTPPCSIAWAWPSSKGKLSRFSRNFILLRFFRNFELTHSRLRNLFNVLAISSLLIPSTLLEASVNLLVVYVFIVASEYVRESFL